jgi:hypothetical protein
MRTKAQTIELVEILILVVGVSLMFIISQFFIVSKYSSSTSQLTEEQEYEKVLNVVKNFLYTKIPVFEKTYGQLLGDMIVNDVEIVDYGKKYGGINVTEVVYEYFSFYFQNNWYLKIPEKNKFFGFNPPSDKKITTFLMRFPIPSYIGDVIDVEFGKW